MKKIIILTGTYERFREFLREANIPVSNKIFVYALDEQHIMGIETYSVIVLDGFWDIGFEKSHYLYEIALSRVRD